MRSLHSDTKDQPPLSTTKGFRGGSAGKESACNAGDPRSIPGLGRSPGEAKGYPLQYSALENPMDCPWGRKESDTAERLPLHTTTKESMHSKEDPAQPKIK